MVFILQYKKRGCSLCYRQNIDKPQLSGVSSTILTLPVPILGSGTLILQKIIDAKSVAVKISKLGGGKSYSGYPNPKIQYPLPSGLEVHDNFLFSNIL